MCGGVTESRVTIATKSHVDFAFNHYCFLLQFFHATLSGDRQHELCRSLILSDWKGAILIQVVYYFNKQNKASLGRNSWLFPRQRPLLPTCSSLVQKNKALMNTMHLLQLFSRWFKHRAAWNYRAGFSQQDDTLYVHPAMSEWIRSSASCTSRSCCVSSLVVSRRC